MRSSARPTSISGLPVSRYVAEGPQEELTRTDVAQPALFAVSLALAELAGECGLSPDFVTGHSLGEYTAAAVSGALDPGDAMRLVCERGRLMAQIQERSPGAMAAVGGVDEARLSELCAQAAEGEALGLANLNSPRQIVVSGEVAAVERLLSLLESEPGTRSLRLPVGAAFHSSLMVPVRDELRGSLEAVEIAQPAVPLVANHSGQPGGRRRRGAHGSDRADRQPGALRGLRGLARGGRLHELPRARPGQGAHRARAPGRRPRASTPRRPTPTRTSRRSPRPTAARRIAARASRAPCDGRPRRRGGRDDGRRERPHGRDRRLHAAQGRTGCWPGCATTGPTWSCWFTDDRCVPPDHEHSNYRMVKESLLDHVEDAARAPDAG